MIGYLAKRLGNGAATVFIVVTFAFFFARIGGSPAVALLGDTAGPDEIAAFEKAHGYDRPAIMQYGVFLKDLSHGEFGTSYRQTRPALQVILERLPATLELALWSLTIGIAVALVLAVLLQLTRSEAVRGATIWLGAARQTMPDFLFAILLVLVFSVSLRWLPSFGRGGVAHAVLPVATLASAQVAVYLRLLTTEIGEQMLLPYVETALAKGQSWPKILLLHILPNALLPLLTVAGVNLGTLIGGTIIVEMVFSWPGVGQVLLTAVNTRDYPVLQTGLIMVAVFCVLINLAIDGLYSVLDPRVRLQ
jgi:peptide/nickel transport system permease protein